MDLSGEYMRPEPTAADAARLEAAKPDALQPASDGVPGAENTWQGSADLHLASYAAGDGAGDSAPAMARNTLITPAEPTTVAMTSAPAEMAVASANGRQIVRSAAVITVGTLLGSILGFVRLITINLLFYGGASGAFTTALRPVQQVNDLIIGGSVSGALIPTFVDYSQVERRHELQKVYSTVATMVTILMVLACAGVIFAAPYFVPFETQRFSPADQQLTVRLVQIAAVSLLGLGLYAVGSALLYALKQVVFPAFATSLYHLAIIICGSMVLLWALYQAGLPFDAELQSGVDNQLIEMARAQGAHGLAIGAVVGAAAEFLLLLIPLRRILKVWRPALHLRHPGVRQIMRLYGPLLLGLFFGLIVQNIDITLMGMTPGGAAQNATSFANAIPLIQFPLGLVTSALAFSVLPVLTVAANNRDLVEFKRTLSLGFRLALTLLVPATVGLFLLAQPIMTLLFQHGACGSDCTYRNVLAIRNLSLQLPFAAFNVLLISAFYARKNTLAPALLSLLCTPFYLAVAIPLSPTVGLPALAFANSLALILHTTFMYITLTITVGELDVRKQVNNLWRLALAAAGMAGVIWGLLWYLPTLNIAPFAMDSAMGRISTLVVVGLASSGVYCLLVSLLRVHELNLMAGMLRARLARNKSAANGAPLGDK